MSDLITFNTEQIAAQYNTAPKPEIFKLVSGNDPILRETMPEFDFSNPSVNPNQFASSLVETCKANHGVGLSANQCGFRYRVFVMGANDEYVAFFNPKVLEEKDEVHMMEGCLSFPLLNLRVTRPKEIVVEYQDFNGKTHVARFNGISARCFLHELDHMNGIVYTDRAKPLALQSGIKKMKKTVKKITQFTAMRQLGKNNVK
jgi:peptide deformylase